MIKHRITVLILSAVMLVSLSSACSSGNKSDLTDITQTEYETNVPEEYEFTDSLERNVVIKKPQKTAVLNGSYAELWQLAGGELAAVTDDAYIERNLDLPDSVINIGAMKNPSTELIIDGGYDFVILSSKVEGHTAILDTLEKLNINCAYFEIETFEDYLSVLKICTGITGRDDLYVKNGLQVQEQINSAIAFGEGKTPPKILFIRAFSTGAKAKGSDNMTGIMLKQLGCINIADGDSSLLEDLSIEKIIAEDPDFIFVVTMGESSEKALASLDKSLISNPAWAGLSAVKNNRYIVLPKDLFHYKPNARWGESYEMLAQLLYGKK